MKYKIRVLIVIFLLMFIKYIYDLNFHKALPVVYPSHYKNKIEVSHCSVTDKKEMEVLFFTATGCMPCAKMKKNVWPHKSIQLAVSEYSNSPKTLNADDEKYIDDFKRYKIEGVPTTIIVYNEGEEIKRSVGYMNVQQLLNFLK